MYGFVVEARLVPESELNVWIATKGGDGHYAPV